MEGRKSSSRLSRCIGVGGQEASTFLENVQGTLFNQFSRDWAQRQSLLDSPSDVYTPICTSLDDHLAPQKAGGEGSFQAHPPSCSVKTQPTCSA